MENVDNMEEDHTGQWTLHYAFLEKRVPKMFNFELLFTYGFSSKYCEILYKSVLIPQEYENYCFGKKIRKKLWKKKLLGVFPQVKIGLKRNLSAK